MKHLKTVIIGIICAALIFGYYYYLSNRDNTHKGGNEQSEVEKVIDLDLDNKYPSTPREVIKVYSRILSCYYNEKYDEEHFQKMAAQQRKLLDEELLANNPEQQFMASMRVDIDEYKRANRTIASYTLCSTDEVIYKTVDGRECAYVICSYFLKDGSKGFENSRQCYVLRKDDNENWKILVYYLLEGESSGE